ncbi:MAG: (deoxy)nucleoside triphosphate pyrophosphohydrolase [Clostridia bacterium]
MIEVVAGIIYKNNKFLIAQRNFKKEQGGLWEFPGGKVEKNESYKSALIREIKEELNADIEISEYIGEIRHHYPEKDIKLIFYKAKLLSQKIELLEHESCKWITKDERDKFEFAGADKTVFDLI